MFDVIDQRGNLLYRTMETPAAYLLEIKCANLMKLGVNVTSGGLSEGSDGVKRMGGYRVVMFLSRRSPGTSQVH